MILKAGTYRFNDVLTEQYPLEQQFDFLVHKGDELVGSGLSISTLYGLDEQSQTNLFSMSILVNEGGETIPFPFYINPVPDNPSYYKDFYPNGWIDGSIYSTQINSDVEVDDTFGTWYIANTNYNEVNAEPLAEITYNGKTIGQLNAGETATLSCEGKKMASDVVVKVNEVESKIPEGYVKPEGQLNVLKNNTTYDVSKYAEVRIATAQPYEVPLESLMNNIISNISQATIGNVYKYTGETSDTYEQGALYILEEVSE